MKWAVVKTCVVAKEVSGSLSYMVKPKAQCSGLRAGAGAGRGSASGMGSAGLFMEPCGQLPGLS